MDYPRWLKKLSHRAGSVLAITAAAAVVFVGMLAVVVDVGYVYFSQAKLQTAVNAGWKAGYDKMMDIQSTSRKFDASDKAAVVLHIKEVMKVNGFTDEQLANIEIDIPNMNSLHVRSNQQVGMFFAKVFSIEKTNISASRGINDAGAGIIPLGIPHGVTKDFSKNMYSCSMFTEGQGFTLDKEYILKLGSGGGNSTVEPGQDDLQMILVPMDAGSQSSTGFLRAYGAAFWCLRIEDGADIGFVPVYWLLGYRGGSFLLPYHADVLKKLNSLSVNYSIITGSDNIQAIFDQVNPNVLELVDRPRIAVYSSQDGTDPVEDVLRAAQIPYGEYSLPSGWGRNDVYKATSNDHIYDHEILNGVLDNYHWVHLHHEDFTGFNGGCGDYGKNCEEFLTTGRLGSTNTSTNRSNVKNRMCSYCSQYYDSNYGFNFARDTYSNTAKKNVWKNNYDGVVANCKFKNTRCAERKGVGGTFWRNDASVTMCGSNDYPQCREYQRLIDIANANGFTSDAGSEPKPQTFVSTGDNGPGMAVNQAGWFDKANKVQKMKFEVARKIRNHVEVGGFLFAQCFAPETLDIALWQAGIHDGRDPVEAFSECFAFTGFEYRRFPLKSGPSYYSTINVLIPSNTSVPFSLLAPLDARCQNHGQWPDTGTGHTSVFSHSCINHGDNCTVLGNRRNYANQAKYLKGKREKGEFTFLGGHWHHNTESKRLVLNNILLGSLVEKTVNGEVTPPEVVGKNKNNYGPLDPDNSLSGGANDYRDRFKFGVNIPIEVNDRLVTESGNMRGPTDEAVGFRINGDADFTPNRRIIVPITDIGPEIGVNNPKNAGIDTIYDLQGQDHPNGVYKPEQYDFGSSVRVIGFAEFEVLDPSEYTRDEKDGLTYESGDAGDLGPYQPGQVRGKFIRYIVNPFEIQELLY